ncbi:MAG TPA: Wzz/FepE/Etk N-terminal domain-containing protein [Patescibacteria group bacterium]|nr:Wzz/FepE/Etk N-terminal domain-containing protein [Patescibacteria group bacterium]
MEEISLRELIETLIRNRRIIAVITILCILVSGVASFFILDPVYEAKTILMASNLLNKQQVVQQQPAGVEGFLETMSQYPQMSIETYKEQINNPHILQQVIDELKLGEKDITRVGLRGMMELGTIKDTNLITITVKYADKVLAKDIANTIARKFTDFVSEKAKEQAAKSSNYIKQQMDIEKANLDQVLLEYKTYLSQPRGLNELKRELESKLDLITQYKADLMNSNIEEQTIRASLAMAEKQLKSTPEKITVNRSLLDEPYISQALEDTTGKNSKELFGVTVEAEEVNSLYTALRSQTNSLNVELAKIAAEKNNLQKEIDTLQKELEILQADLADKQHQDTIIQEKVKFANNTYNAFLEKYEETRIAKSSAIGDASIIIISPAVEPLEPIAPRKLLNIAIGTVLGMMLGVFIAFFKDYWQATDPKKAAGNGAHTIPTP